MKMSLKICNKGIVEQHHIHLKVLHNEETYKVYNIKYVWTKQAGISEVGYLHMSVKLIKLEIITTKQF